jgi:dTDP-glucose 4,6-dehydratase
MKSNKLTKLNLNNYIKKVNDRPGHDKRYALDSSLLKKIINYKQSKDLHTGLRETIFWYINNKKWLKNSFKFYKFKRLGLID